MVERLRSILRTTHWSLIAKAALFAGSWLFLPFWLSFFVGVGLYFVPWFRPIPLLMPLIATLAFAAILVPSAWTGIFLGTVFFLILGIKDLVLVNRGFAYQSLFYLLFFLISLNFFLRFDRFNHPELLAASLALGATFFLLGAPLARFVDQILGEDRRPTLFFALGGFLIWQWTWALVFLPLNFFYQAALLFLAAVFLTQMLLDHLMGDLDRRRILLYFSVFFIFASFILAANPWHV